jgi:hypothetical protein
VGIVAGFIAIGHELVAAYRDAQFLACDAGERLERRPRGPATIRAMAIKGIGERVGDRVAHGAAIAFSGKHASIRISCFHHEPLLIQMTKSPIAQSTASWLNRCEPFCLEDRPVSHDRSTVEAVVKNYFDGLYEGDAEKLGAVFHSSADLRWLEKGELQVLTVPDWLDRVRKRPSAKAEGKPREDFIVTIDRSDEQTAFIKVRCQLPPRYFTDYLVAMKLNDGWRIVSKSYRYDLRE